MRFGVIATVPWRAEALEITAQSLAVQNAKLDGLLIFYDGPCQMSVTAESALMELAPTIEVQMSPRSSGGAWERIRRAHALFGNAGELFVFDDDMRYPSDYVERLFGYESPVGLGGVTRQGKVRSYEERWPLMGALELQLGTSALPLKSLDGLAGTDVVRELLSNGGWATEAVLGWWWWKHGLAPWIVPGPLVRPAPVILPHGGATDPRALYRSSGMNRRAETWKRLSELTDWPDVVLQARDRATPDASS